MAKKSKKYVVRLTVAERQTLEQVIGKFKGTSQKVRRAQVLLKADADGPDWTDAKIADAFGCRTQSVENIRERFVTQGFELTLNGRPHAKPPRQKVLDGEQEAKVIAMRLSAAAGVLFPTGRSRLLARQVVTLEIAKSISHETVRRTLKKTG